MTRHVLRKGFSLEAAPEGVGHLTDSRTGDVLVVPATDFPGLVAAIAEGTEPLALYAPFFVGQPESADSGFYELDIEDAPTGVNLPAVVPVPIDRASAPTLSNVSTAQLELEVALAASRKKAAEQPLESPTDEHPSLELKLPADELESTLPGGLLAAPAPDLSQEENLRQALETHPTEQVSRADVQAILDEAAHGVAPEPLSPSPRGGEGRGEGIPNANSRKPLLLTVGAVLLLAAGVAATFALRPNGETQPLEQPMPTRVVVPDGPTPTVVIDAGAEAIVAVAEVPDAAVIAATEPDAGAVKAIESKGLDAGTPGPDAGIAVEVEMAEGANWVRAELQARGRVKMGEVVASADGELTWAVADGQRVKAKQALGTVAGSSLSAPSVGLAMIKQPSGSSVKRGAVLAEIIYFEAWARGVVKGATPTTAWKCQVVSGAQTADCKISVVAPRGSGSQVTVAIEPRWFDGASDAVLRLAPP